MYVDLNVAGQKAWLVVCLLPPHSVSRTVFLLKLIMTVILFFLFCFVFYKAENITKVMLFALAFYKVSIH